MAGTSNVKLLGARASPFANRVQIALNLKSLDYEFIQENLAQKSELLLKSNPVHKKVPVLIHGEKTPICESLVIVEYIDETWPDGPSIRPSDPHDRATARFWGAYIDNKWFPAFMAALSPGEKSTAVLENIGEGLTLLEDLLVKCSNGEGFFGGEDIGYIDIVLGCFLEWVKVAEITSNVKRMDEIRTPALVGWSKRFTSHGAVKGTLTEAEELLIVLKAMQG